MNLLVLLLLGVLLLALIAVLGLRMLQVKREKQRTAQENAVAKAAHDYLSRFKVRARIVAMLLPDDKMVLLIETPPQKRLRFSYIIEQPIKNYVRVHTGVDLGRIFWRFPIPPKASKAADVHYVDPTTISKPSASAKHVAPAPIAEAAPAPSAKDFVAEDDDEYFRQDSYRIEEVSWEDFSTISGNGREAGEAPVKTK